MRNRRFRNCRTSGYLVSDFIVTTPNSFFPHSRPIFSVNRSAALICFNSGYQLCMSRMITRKRACKFGAKRIDHLLLNQIHETTLLKLRFIPIIFSLPAEVQQIFAADGKCSCGSATRKFCGNTRYEALRPVWHAESLEREESTKFRRSARRTIRF